MTKFKSGKMRLAKDHFSLRTLLEEVHLTMEHSFPEVTQAMECSGMFCVIGSPRHLKQVLQNLARRDSAEHFLNAQPRPGFSFPRIALPSRCPTRASFRPTSPKNTRRRNKEA